MPNVAVLSANLGNFEAPVAHVRQSIEINPHCFTDRDFPRRQTMNARLQARIPKMFGWDMWPGADVYIWLDASFRLAQEASVNWFLRSLAGCDFAFFRHPWRKTIREEAQFIQERIVRGNRYLIERYEGEDITGQLRAVLRNGYTDDTLLATMAFAYRPNERARRVLADWWIHTSRFHAVDQLALPYLLWDHGASVATLEGNPYRSQWIEYVRKR